MYWHGKTSHNLTWKLIKQDTKQCVWSRGLRGKEAFSISLHNFLLDLQIRSLLPENLGYIPGPWLIQIVHSLPPQIWGFRMDEPGAQCLRGSRGLPQIYPRSGASLWPACVPLADIPGLLSTSSSSWTVASRQIEASRACFDGFQTGFIGPLPPVKMQAPHTKSGELHSKNE